MTLKNKTGSKVTNKKGETGTIVSINDYIEVDFGDRKTRFQKDAFIKGYLKFADTDLQKEVMDEIEALKVEEAKQAEERRIAAEKVAEERAKKAVEEAETKKPSAGKTKKPVKLEDMFGPDYHVEHLKRHPILTYQDVESQFGIKITGFGRGINITDDSLVLISSMDKKNGKFVYHDHWTPEGDYIFSGEGKSGDQQMTKGNRAIADAAVNAKSIYLFVKLTPQEYYFQGKFVLVDYLYENELDEDGNMRKEYKFRLRKIADPAD